MSGNPSSSTQTIDDLADRAAAGDRAAESSLFEVLRVRFIQISKRRVREDHVEDVVHDSLKIVLAKYRDRDGKTGFLIWSLTVLRNVIGNYYQASRRQGDRQSHVEDWQTLDAASVRIDPTDSMESDQGIGKVREAIAALAGQSQRCGKIFAGITESLKRDGSPREISMRALGIVQREFPEMTRNTFYVALHRCRARLRTLLDKMEERPA